MAADIASHILTGGAGLAMASLLVRISWNGDDAVSEAYQQRVRDRIHGAAPGSATEWPLAFRTSLDRFLGIDALRLRFMIRSTLIAVVLVLIFFATYLAVFPGFLSSIWNDPFQRSAVLKQIVVQTALVTAAATWLCLAYSGLVAVQMERQPGMRAMLLFLMRDLVVKTLVILAGLLFVYLAFTQTEGAFGGNPLLAVLSVPETFLEGLRFRNLSAVYIYSAYASSVWLWAYAIAWMIAPFLRFVSGALRWDQFPIRSLGVLAATIMLCGYYAIYAVWRLVA